MLFRICPALLLRRRWSNYSDGATGMRALRGFLDMPRPVLSLLEPQIRWVKVRTASGRGY